MANKKEQGFNDAELQDIMSEIENLEREYEDDAPVSKETEVEVVVQEDSVEETIAETTEDNVVSFEQKVKTKSHTSSGEQQVEFQGSGQMNFAMNFEVAGQTAHLEITEAGLVVSLDGMHLSVNETEGCTVEMEGGVKFSVPMSTKAKSSKAA
ncbi:MAG: hypothetical protein ACJAT2_000926 [Bacteriovoracaceae bacterium]|jgi:hypothetical protein